MPVGPSTTPASSSQSALAERRAALAAGAREDRLEAERLDLTEVVPGARPGHRHLVTQTIERLEDVFVGMGYSVAEGPEAETDWYNFEALNMPPSHPARSMWDTFYLELGPPESTVLRTHTSPVQIRVMEATEPPGVVGHARPLLPEGDPGREPPGDLSSDRGARGRPGHHHGPPGRDHRLVHRGLLRRRA